MIEHYNNIARNFERYWNFSDGFVNSVTQDIISDLELSQRDTLLDIGCGTGLYTTRIAQAASLKFPVVCLDTSIEMLKEIKGESIIKRCTDALVFLEQTNKFSKVLAKEVLHHISDKEKFIQGIANALLPGGIALIIISPVKVEYPLFKKALDIRQKGRSLENYVVATAEKMGLSAKLILRSYPVSFDKEKYFQMISGRYMSFLSKLSDSEIMEGIMEMKENLKDQQVIEFKEEYIFIVIKKY